MKLPSPLVSLRSVAGLIFCGLSCMTANAQTISINGFTRTTGSTTTVNSINGETLVQDGNYASSDPNVQSTSDGGYNASFTQGASFLYGSANVNLSTNSTITDSATSLAISGTMQETSTAHSTYIINPPPYTYATSGYGVYGNNSAISAGFNLDQAFSFSLQATISANAAPNDYNQYYVTLFDSSGPLYTFGVGTYNGFIFNGPDSANLTGTLPAGSYDFEVSLVGSDAAISNNNNPPIGDAHTDSSVSFALNVTAAPEPSSALLMLGSGAMFLMRRRRAAV